MRPVTVPLFSFSCPSVYQPSRGGYHLVSFKEDASQPVNMAIKKMPTIFHPRFPRRNQALLRKLEVMEHLQYWAVLEDLMPLVFLKEMKEKRRENRQSRLFRNNGMQIASGKGSVTDRADTSGGKFPDGIF